MSDLQAIAARDEIEALRGEFTDGAMMRDYDQIATQLTPTGPCGCRISRPNPSGRTRSAPSAPGCRR